MNKLQGERARRFTLRPHFITARKNYSGLRGACDHFFQNQKLTARRGNRVGRSVRFESTRLPPTSRDASSGQARRPCGTPRNDCFDARGAPDRRAVISMSLASEPLTCSNGLVKLAFVDHRQLFHRSYLNSGHAEVLHDLAFYAIKAPAAERMFSGNVGEVNGVENFTFTVQERAEVHQVAS